MAVTDPVLLQSGEAIARLSDLITTLIESTSTSVADRDKAKADLASLLIADTSKDATIAADTEERVANQAAAQATLEKINKLVEIAAAANTAPVNATTPAPVPTPASVNTVPIITVPVDATAPTPVLVDSTAPTPVNPTTPTPTPTPTP